MPRDPVPQTRTFVQVLVVDDNSAARRALTTLLRHEPDIRVVGEAADGKQALDQIVTTQPDVVLLDVRMPILDGVATAQIIHREFPHIRVIGISVGPDDPAAEAMCRAGATTCVSKRNRPAILAAIRQCGPRREGPSRRQAEQ